MVCVTDNDGHVDNGCSQNRCYCEYAVSYLHLFYSILPCFLYLILETHVILIRIIVYIVLVSFLNWLKQSNIYISRIHLKSHVNASHRRDYGRVLSWPTIDNYKRLSLLRSAESCTTVHYIWMLLNVSSAWIKFAMVRGASPHSQHPPFQSYPLS